MGIQPLVFGNVHLHVWGLRFVVLVYLRIWPRILILQCPKITNVVDNLRIGQLQLSNEKIPGCFWFVGDYTTQFFRDHNKP